MSKPTWERPRTTKIYLHPPFAERLQVLWPDFKVTNSDITDNDQHLRLHGSGFIVLRGGEMEQVDYRNVRFAPVEGGLPRYTLISEGDIRLTLETFAQTGPFPASYDRTPALDSPFRNPAVFARITAENTTALPQKDCIGILPRTGQESYLMNEHDTGYTPYYPNVKNWYMLKRTWSGNETEMQDDEGTSIRLQNLRGFRSSFVKDGKTRVKFEASDFMRLDFDLAAGESASCELSFQAYGKAPAFSWNEEAAAHKAYWDGFLARVDRFPDTDNAVYQAAYRHLIVQCLQMLCHYQGSDLLVPRQGDVGRFIWPSEADSVVILLERAGLAEYTLPVHDYFLDRWMQRGGEDDGKICSIHQQWGRINGSVIGMISKRLLRTRDQAEFDHFKPELLRMLGWIQREREKSSTDGKSLRKGIFPVGKGCDWDDVAQFWTGTDAINVEGIFCMADAFEAFGAPEADRIREIGKDYLAILQDIFREQYEGHENDPEFIVEHMLGVSFEDSERYPHSSVPAELSRAGIIDAKSHAFEQMEAFYRRTGRIHKTGLLGIMTSCTCYCDEGYFGGYGDVYYTIQAERRWMRAWMARGEYDKAEKSLLASLHYGMTPEFVVAERYCSTDPWYSPWQPNASGSAALAEMMLDFFGETSRTP